MTLSRTAALVCAALLAAAGLAAPTAYRLPAAEPRIEGTGADADLVNAYCSACHSIDYALTQPPHKGRQFWQDTVTKMINVYGAPIPPEDAGKIVSYLDSKL